MAFHEKDICDLQPKIPYWWCKSVPHLVMNKWLVQSVITYNWVCENARHWKFTPKQRWNIVAVVSVKRGWLAYKTSTVYNIFVHLLFSDQLLNLSVALLVFKFMKGTSCCVIRGNFRKSWAITPCYGIFLEVIGLHDFIFPLLSACRFVYFDTSVICRNKSMKFSVNMLLPCTMCFILYKTWGLAVIRTDSLNSR